MPDRETMKSERQPVARLATRSASRLFAAMFAGASRALLASVVFAFETTRQSVGLLPLLGGCSAAYLIAGILAKHSIMTEKIARRGRAVPSDYSVDFLAQVLVRDIGCRPVITLRAEQAVAEARAWLDREGAEQHHHGFPVVDADEVAGVVTRRELLDPKRSPKILLLDVVARPPVVIGPEATAREAADLMVREGVGRLPVVERGCLVGIVTRSDLLDAHRVRLVGEHHTRRLRGVLVASGEQKAR